MAKIVELVGSPGVGKTTLYKHLQASWNKNYNWMPSQHFYPKKETIAESTGSLISDILRWIKNRKGRVDMRAMEEAGGRFVELFPDYIDACWNHINCTQKKNLNGLDLRFQKVSYLYKLIQKVQTVREQENDKIAIIDEGLIHIINSILYKREAYTEEKEEIEHLLEIMPVPQGIVYVETDVEENVKRLSQRKKVIPMHKALVKGELEIFVHSDHNKRAVINTIIESKNIPFLRINSIDTIANNVSKIISFAENLK
jgi:thymidylate kinase